MWEAGRNWLRRFLIEVPHPAFFILLLVPLASGTGVYPENNVLPALLSGVKQVPFGRWLRPYTWMSSAGLGRGQTRPFGPRTGGRAVSSACSAL
jgi:hypothetical protein